MIQCLLVDDEPYALELLGKHLAVFPDIEVAARCSSIQEAIPVLQTTHIDLLFLDVKMPSITGMEFLEKAQLLPQVVLTTAYREYALQAYEFGVLDYLLKPISFMRFARAIERYRQRKAGTPGDVMDTPVVFKSGIEYYRVLPKDIAYIQSRKEYVDIVCNGARYMVRSSMREILQQLPENHFIQVHKSYIAPAAALVTVTSAEVIIAGNIKLPLGRLFAPNVKKLLGGRS